MSKNVEEAFITTGFNNRKYCSQLFEQHRKGACHREATIKWAPYSHGRSRTTFTYRKSCELKKKGFKDFCANYLCPLNILPALSGHKEENGNFYQLMQLRSNDSVELRTWLRRWQKLMYHHDVEKAMLKTMSHQIQRSIVKEDHASTWYSVISDETVAASLVPWSRCVMAYSLYVIYLYSTARSRWITSS